MMAMEFPEIRVLGSRLHMVDIPTVVSLMERWCDGFLGDRRCRQIVVSGFHGIWESYKNAELKGMLNSADLWVPDGIAPVWVARLKGMLTVDRTPGAEIMQAFFEKADRKGYRSFFYGDTDETLAALKKNLEDKYPGHKVVGTFSPPFRALTLEEDEEIVGMINAAKPDVLWVGLGTPKQDRWIHEHRDRLDVPVALGVGAAFGFLAGKVERVPDWIGRNGFEWLWRLVKEPKKLWRRDLIEGPRFVLHALLELAGLRKYD